MVELSRNRIVRKGAQAKIQNNNFTVMCSRSPENLDFLSFQVIFVLKRMEKNCSKLYNARARPLFCDVLVAVAVVAA